MKKSLIIITCCLLLTTAASAGQLLSLGEGADSKTVSIDLRDSDIVDVLKFLGQKGKFNIFISPKIQGRVTLFLENVRIVDIFDFILLSNNLAFRQKGNIVYAMTQEEYKTRYGEDYGDAREVSLSRLKYAVPSQIFKMLEPSRSAIGRIVVDEQTGTIVLMDLPEKVDFMMKVIHEMDQPMQTRLFDISYGKAKDIQALISSQVDLKGVASITADERSNQVVVTAFPDRIKEIETVIAKLDRKTREVTIDTQIVKVVLSDDYKQGVDWRYMFQNGVLEPLDFNVNLPQTLASFGSISYSRLGSRGFEAVYNFLKTLGESKILASPRLTVVEGQEAKILIGTREAYVTTSTTTSSGTATTAESISFIDVGISLTVAPLINKEGYVTMTIKPEVSSVVRTLTTPSGNEIPIVDTTEAETRVMVKDGATIVIGGLRKDEKKHTIQKLPGFSNIPLIGSVFRNVDSEIEQTELIVFLTPHIIEGDKSVATDGGPFKMKGLQGYTGIAVEPPPAVTQTSAIIIDPNNGGTLDPIGSTPHHG